MGKTTGVRFTITDSVNFRKMSRAIRLHLGFLSSGFVYSYAAVVSVS